MERQTGLTDIVAEIERSGAGKVKLAISDMDGVLRGKYIHRDKFLSAAEEGFGFCDVVFGWDCGDVCYDNTAFTGWHTGYPDAQARIDLSTHRRIPWEDGVDFFLCDFEDGKGQPLPICPRQVLKRTIERLRATGYEAKVGFEYEWFNFRETPQSLAEKQFANIDPITPGMFGYSVLRSGLNHAYFRALMDQLEAFGTPLEGLHTETGPGTYEAALGVSDALEAADRAALFKSAVKQIAYAHGFVASFMARWNASLPGCGGHIHHSLVDAKTGQPCFFDPARPKETPPALRHFLAGQMHALPELLALYAPVVNSYKRLVEGYWAPTSVTWGHDNRTVCYRVLTGSAKSARIECRVPGADANPYLALAALLASGLYGLENKLEPPEPVSGSGYSHPGPKLSKNLGEAAQRIAKSELARKLLGEEFVDHFAQTRLWEWRQFERALTDWELKRYFELI